MRNYRSIIVVLAALWVGLAAGCRKDSLSVEIGNLKITPDLAPRQTALEDPVGIHLGDIPLFGTGTAKFIVENDSRANVQISAATVEDATGGEFVVVSFPEKLASTEVGELVIQFNPAEDEVTGSAVIQLTTDTGIAQDAKVPVQVQGKGYFVGEPRLEVVYGGETYPVEGNCSPGATGHSTCQLDTLSFGNIPLDSSATQSITLRNSPEVGTCLLPALPDGTPDCTPVCVITFDKLPDVYDIGLGFTPDDQGFGLVGAASTPFQLAPANPSCTDDGVLRGDLPLLISFQASAEEGDHASTMILESNAPNAQVVEIPLTAASRNAPVAVAKIRECTETILTDCSDANTIEPLSRIYLDGVDSYDPADPDNPSAIVGYRWEVIEFPPGTDTTMFDLQGTGSAIFSMWMPLAGRYTARLHVTNNVGIESGVSETSDVTFIALPDSRMHIQVVWDTATTDLDMHLVHADPTSTDGEAYHATRDCYWLSCRPGCEDFPTNECEQATQWFPEHPAFEGPNPRLDIDDTNGLGPENVNIDLPNPGDYHVYVHYYAIGSGEASVRTLATVRIYADGVLHADFRRALEKNNLWAVGSIQWNADADAVVTPAASDEPNAIGAVKDLPYVPAGGVGYDFGEVF